MFFSVMMVQFVNGGKQMPENAGAIGVTLLKTSFIARFPELCG